MAERSDQVILIPAYMPDEALVALTMQLSVENFRTVVVNDGSGPGFNDVFERLPEDVTVVAHATNRGKGKALRTGMQYILEAMPDARGIVTADADGQHLASDILQVAEHLVDRTRAVVIGGRRFEGKVPLHNRVGNLITRWVFSLATRVKVRDTQTGLRGFTMDLVPELLRLPGDRYEYEINVLLWAASNHVDMEEIPIKTVYLEGNTSSHYRVMRDSVIIYSRILKFILSSFAAFIVDFSALFLIRSQLGGMEDSRALLLSVVGARVISSTFNFIVNRKLVFNSREKASTSAWRYFLLAAFILLCNYLLMHLFSLTIGMPLVAAKLMVEGLLFLASYLIQKKIVFKANEKFPHKGKGVRDVTESDTAERSGK
jgi:putative flippase GtrA